MRHGSLFSGIGGFDLAAEWMGWENVFHCEWNEFGQKVLHHYWPNVETFTDITKSDFTKYANKIDILTGGFPCQPYSQAGKRQGKEDARHLWPEMLRAIREIKPKYIVGKMFLDSLIGMGEWYSMRCILTWSLRGTKSRPWLYLRRRSMPHTDVTAFGLLPTITTMDHMEPKTDKAWSKEMNETRKGRTKPANLRDVPKRMPHLLPTPTAMDSKGGGTGQTEYGKKQATNKLKYALPNGLLPTPNTCDAHNANNKDNHDVNRGYLRGYATMGMLPTPTCQDSKQKENSPSQQHKINELSIRVAGGSNSQLNPQFVAEMMGFPPNWTELPFQSGEMNP